MELQPKWLDIAKRLQSMARKHDGIVILQVSIVATGSGAPIMWIPKCVPIEPRLDMDLAQLRDKLGEEDLQHILEILMLKV